MDKGFLYRRLAPIFPLCFPHVPAGEITLSNKNQLASFSEVFLNPHYWRLFDLLESPPRTVVDLGGNCGHFPVLCEFIIRSKFNASSTRYHVFEAVSAMIKNISAAVEAAQIGDRTTVVHGAVGKKHGEATLTGGKRSMLDSSAVHAAPDRRFRERVRYIDLQSYLDDHSIGEIDVLKVDIEGSEYDLMETFPELFQRVRYMFMELHNVDEKWDSIQKFFTASGLNLVLPAIETAPHKLVVLRKRSQPSWIA
jgi:FkbM family methyltransferase